MTRTLTYIFSLLLISNSLSANDEITCGHAMKEQTFANRDVRWITTEQVKYDVLYYAIDVELFPATNSTIGSYLTRLEIIDASITEVQLDFYDMSQREIELVTLNGDTTDYDHHSDILSVALGEGVDLGDTLEVIIQASTGPMSDCDNCGFNWTYKYGEKLIYSNSQPYSAREWWPCKDYAQDKPDSMDIRITVPDELVVASNGVLRSITDLGDGRSTWHWHEGYPIATYLVSLGIYPYFVWGDEYVTLAGDTLPLEFYTFRDTNNSEPAYLVDHYRMLPEMLSLYEELFGPYPFPDEKYGHAEWGESWGMEHQTITSMGDPTERRVAHELAHMWWGDMITLETYHDIWLNEGFARYAEALWWEHTRGEQGLKDKMEDFAYYGTGTIYIEDPEHDNIFNLSLSYNKASWVLHMLRHIVGDVTFFDILHQYGANSQFAYGTANTAQFKGVCETVSGLDLGNFFNQWIYGQSYPHYLARWYQLGDTLELDIIQQGIAFDMPVDIQINTGGSLESTVIQIDEARETFYVLLPSSAPVDEVVLDPDDWVLKSATVLVGIDNEANWPCGFALEPNVPNPFNPSTTISFQIEEQSMVELTVYDLQGRLVETLAQDQMGAGAYSLRWTPEDESAGIYLALLSDGHRRETIKLLYLK